LSSRHRKGMLMNDRLENKRNRHGVLRPDVQSVPAPQVLERCVSYVHSSTTCIKNLRNFTEAAHERNIDGCFDSIRAVAAARSAKDPNLREL